MAYTWLEQGYWSRRSGGRTMKLEEEQNPQAAETDDASPIRPSQFAGALHSGAVFHTDVPEQ